MKKLSAWTHPWKPGKRIKLAEIPTNAACGYTKKKARKICAENAEAISELSYRLDAEGKRSILIILQGMDAAGKDGAIRHFISALNPQSCTVVPFKQPSTEELAHDFLWRIHKEVPRRGRMAIFNRSHYEDALVVRVHGFNGTKYWNKKDWQTRFDQINAFEQLLVSSGTTVVKLFLHISKDEQRKRLQARMDDPERKWKLCLSDLEERKLWSDYQEAYEDILQRCGTSYAPWYVVPADKKWQRDLVISSILRDTLEVMKPKFPDILPEMKAFKGKIA